MYILHKNNNINLHNEITQPLIAVILPSTPKKGMVRFKEIINETVNDSWKVQFLSYIDNERSPSKNTNTIYNANIVIAECTQKKPNVFYMIGLAHAFGHPVCSCYRVEQGGNADIPFNVHGRQSLTYSLTTIKEQEEFKNNLKNWIKNYEQN